jgi:predicted dehydrogenase
MALSVAQCREMVEEARSRNMRLAVAYYRRFWPQVRALKRLVEEGVAGRLMNARIQICGDVGREPAPVLEWKLKPELSGGGFLLDVGGHRIELLLYLFGNIEAVAAFTEPRNHPVDLGTGLLLRFAGGAFALASFNWTATYPRDEFEVMGTEATILALPLGGERLLLRGRGPEREIVTGCAAFTHAEMIQQTVDAIKRGEPLEAGGDLGLQVSAIIEAAYVAAKEGRIVSVNEVLEGMCATGR